MGDSTLFFEYAVMGASLVKDKIAKQHIHTKIDMRVFVLQYFNHIWSHWCMAMEIFPGVYYKQQSTEIIWLKIGMFVYKHLYYTIYLGKSFQCKTVRPSYHYNENLYTGTDFFVLKQLKSCLLVSNNINS